MIGRDYLPTNINNDDTSGSDSEGHNPCPVCNGKATKKRMVQCFKCEEWVHFKCAGVSEEVKDIAEWLCPVCATQKKRSQRKDDRSKVPIRTSSNLENPSGIESGAIPSTSNQPNQAKEVFQGKTYSRVSNVSSRRKETIMAQLNNSRQRQELLLQRQIEVENEAKLLKELELHESERASVSVPSTHGSRRGLPEEAQNHGLPDPPVCLPIQEIEAPFQLRGRPTLQGNQPVLGPTPQQISARHGVRKQLPKFGGNPSQWPMFMTNYTESTRVCGFTTSENLVRLQDALEGRARSLVEGLLKRPEDVPNIIETLKRVYGRPEILLRELKQKARNLPAPKTDDLNGLVTYAIEVHNITCSLEDATLDDYRRDPEFIGELTDKLPSYLKNEWVRARIDKKDVVLYGNWIFEYAMSVLQEYPSVSQSFKETKESQEKPKKKVTVGVHCEAEPTTSKTCRKCPIDGCNSTCIHPSQCEVFKKANVKYRNSCVSTLKLCYRCLKSHSFANPCRNPVPCTVDGCKKRHHPLLHYASKTPPPEASKQPAPVSRPEPSEATEQSTPVATVVNSHAHCPASDVARFRYIPVTLYYGDYAIVVYAFLDEGSSTTLATKHVARALHARGIACPLQLKWTDESVVRDEQESEKITLTIKIGTKFYSMGARTISSLALPEQSLNFEDLARKYKHLRGLPIKSYDRIQPDILIGLDNWHLAVPLKTVEGRIGEPIAMKCRLGWSIFAMEGRNQVDDSFFHCCKERRKPLDEDLTELVKSFYAIDRLGVKPNADVLQTAEEKRALQIMTETTRRRGNRFETGLIWKFDNVQLPDSRPMALKRLKCLEASCRRNPERLETINKLLLDYIDKGYAQILTPEELRIPRQRISYVPLFVVTNPNKPSKIRPVWDFAAEVNGVSMNDVLLSGPDLTAPLLRVLFRFRQKQVIVVGDIKEMFHRILINEADQHVQRFLWREGETSREPDEYILRVMSFGATCSPSCAQFVKNLNAEEFATECPEAKYAIQQNHYVDDWLQSFDDKDEALRVAQQVKDVHSRGGFEIRNWRSNSKHVTDELGERCEEEVNLQLSEEQTEKFLGVWYSSKRDAYTFSLKLNKAHTEILSGQRTPTKRELLRTLMSIYDPIGLISQFTIRLKILMQDTFRSKMDWDERITEEQNNSFRSCMAELPKIERLYIPRCYTGNWIVNGDVDIQLHTFVDASEKAQCAVCYFRIEKGGEVRCSQIASKTHVAPLKLVSIPDMELEAAVLGSRLAQTVKKYHEYVISKQFFWSDSRVTLYRLQSNDLRKLRKFTAFRVAEVQDRTNIADWRFVPTMLNVADDGTKVTKATNLDASDRWYKGPEFLYNPESEWPREPIEQINVEEVVSVHHVKDSLIDVNRFSTWKSLRKTVAFIQQAFCKPQPFKVNCKGYKKAEYLVFNMVQTEAFREEMNLLKQGKTVPRKSPLFKFSPKLDEDDNVIRVRGRIDAVSSVSDDTKQPIILPKNHHVTRLIIEHYHRLYFHIHSDTVINELRQKFAIPALRALVRKVKFACIICQIREPKIIEAEMAPLPAGRLTTFAPVFAHTGVDFFGPFLVTVKRSREKRYGVIFTCLTTRAVHVEVAYGLDVNNCIISLRNFMCLRGQPDTFYSDNGGNFVAAQKVVCDGIIVNFDEIANHFEDRQIKWCFNPPRAPSMGGAWERLVRTIKTAFYAALPQRNLTDPLLRACMSEAVHVVNSRPLTYLPLDSKESEALTPNHFIFGNSNGVHSTKKVPADDVVCIQNSYLASQQFRNKMWKRFIKEYLPDLVRRTKNFVPTEPLRTGDIVIVCDDTLPSNSWPKGIIIETFPGKDKQVRSAKVRTSTGTYHRPTSKLAKLDIKSSI